MVNIGLDFETYYSTSYSLRRMSTSEYILGDPFQVICVSIRLPGAPAYLVWETDGEAIQKELDRIWDLYDGEINLIGHNLKFDGAILAWVYNKIPKRFSCTLAVARAVLGGAVSSHGLGAVAERLGLSKQKGTFLSRVNGLRREDILADPELKLGMETYCGDDVDICLMVYAMLKSQVPDEEWSVIDWTIRMFVEPLLTMNAQILEDFSRLKAKELQDVLEKVNALGIWPRRTDTESLRKAVASRPTLVNKLQSLGVEVPKKISAANGKETFALSKQDHGFIELMGHEDERVRVLVEAKLTVSSTLDRTRPAKYLAATKNGEMAWPVDLHYSGATTTHRLSGGGGGGGNPQNLGKKSPLREAVEPFYEDDVLVVADLTAIELCVQARLSGNEILLEQLRRSHAGLDRDPYCLFADDVFSRTITKADGFERTVGKVGQLALQYGVGAGKFNHMVWSFTGKSMDPAFCKRVVDMYRKNNPVLTERRKNRVPGLWKTGENAVQEIRRLQNNMSDEVVKNFFPHAPFLELTRRGIKLPGGLFIKYLDIQEGFGDYGKEYTYKAGRFRKKLYGGLITENLCQAIARQVIIEHTIEINKRWPVVMSVHDEVVLCVPREEKDEALAFVEKIMSAPPKWWPDLPVACESGWGLNYKDAAP